MPVTGTSTMKASKPDRPAGSTSDRLMAVAARLFRSKGYAATTTREIAKLVGIEKSSLYHHIQGKEDLLYKLCVESLSNMHGAVESRAAGEANARNRLRAVIDTHVTVMLADRDKHATMLGELRSLSGPRRVHVIKLRDKYEGLVRDVISGCQTSGLLRSDIEATMLTLALLNLLNWSIFWYRPDGKYSPSELARILTSVYVEGAGN